MPCPVVVPVQTILTIQLFPVILVRLDRAGRGKHTAERIIMVHFLHSSCRADHHPVVTLMVLQVVMVLPVRQGDVADISQQQFRAAVLIDHIAKVISRGGNTAYSMRRPQLRAAGGIQVRDRVTVTERDLARQI